MKKLLAVLLTMSLFSAPALAQAQEQAAAAEENIGGALGSDFVQDQPQIASAGKNTEGTIASAVPQTQSGNVAGEWKLTSGAASGMTLTPEQCGIVEYKLVFNTDGTCSSRLSTIDGAVEEDHGTWSQSGIMVTAVSQANGETVTFSLQTDGTLRALGDGAVLFFTRISSAPQTPDVPSSGSTLPAPSAVGQTATGNGFTMQVPLGWMIINDATVQQLIQTYGQQAVDSSGINSQLQYVKSMGILLYYSADFNSSVYVTQENAQGVTMDTFLSMEQTFASYYANSGMTGFDMAGPVDFSGKTYYTGTFGASNPMKLYYQIVNGVLYTVTLTGVSDTDAALILGSFTVNG